MSNNRRKPWFDFGWHPSEDELLLFLDGEASDRQGDKLRRHLEGCWACRNQREKLERAIATFMDYCAVEASDSSTLPPRAGVEFSERLRQAASTQPKSSLIRRTAESLRWQFSERRVIATAMGLLLLMALGLVFLRAERPVTAQELLHRTTQAESLRLSRVMEPVVYRRLLVKRSGVSQPIVLESWVNTANKEFRRRVADGHGERAPGGDAKDTPAIIGELERILRANRFDPQHPLSASAFSEWRQSVNTQSETVTENGDELRLTTVATSSSSVDAIEEATLIVRKRDWHAVTLLLRARSEAGPREFELSETTYEVIPAQALPLFTDSPLASATISPRSPNVSATSALAAASPKSTPETPSRAALRAAEVAALYALHQAQADLGEQVEVTVEDGRQVVVRGLLQTAQRKEELLKLLDHLELVSLQLQTVEEAIQHPRQVSPSNAVNDVAPSIGENVASGRPDLAINPFQQALIEHFGGRKGMSEEQRQQVNRQVTHFYNTVETEASAALSEAWALRRLHDRFAANGEELDTTSRQQVQEIRDNHLKRIRGRVSNLHVRLHPLLVEIAGASPTVPPSTEVARPGQIQEVFQAIERVSRLTDQLIAGESAASLPQSARALLTELTRLNAILATIEKH